jgi:hypothetical protein
MPILFWVVYPFAIWTACFEALPVRAAVREEKRELQNGTMLTGY